VGSCWFSFGYRAAVINMTVLVFVDACLLDDLGGRWPPITE
jgi:hypothetical protein